MEIIVGQVMEQQIAEMGLLRLEGESLMVLMVVDLENNIRNSWRISTLLDDFLEQDHVGRSI